MLFDFEIFGRKVGLLPWFPIGWSRTGGCGVAKNSLSSLLKARIFGAAYTNVVCCISKTEIRTDLGII